MSEQNVILSEAKNLCISLAASMLPANSIEPSRPRTPLRMTEPGDRKAKTPRENAKSLESDDPVIEALQARLEGIEKEIVRLTDLATTTTDRDEQQQYWDLARELQRDARQTRAAIQSRSQAGPSWLRQQGLRIKR